ncbi:PREDICTED: cold and drought-regulated protein CORA-like [Nelumbo nucifera]|uniref:Cold and drought-regulated protein CORA-like n=1 Tax=Nelumbo nucifera TaxID=4432 RepID=A0A1U8AGY1_NELNU|nr:PREDICTED: cold and drought-regulated protein CORA-like [Nelumbo nucifera]
MGSKICLPLSLLLVFLLISLTVAAKRSDKVIIEPKSEKAAKTYGISDAKYGDYGGGFSGYPAGGYGGYPGRGEFGGYLGGGYGGYPRVPRWISISGTWRIWRVPRWWVPGQRRVRRGLLSIWLLRWPWILRRGL